MPARAKSAAPAAPSRLDLGSLRAGDAAELTRGVDLDGTEIGEAEAGSFDVREARLTDCRLQGLVAEEVTLRGSRLVSVELADLRVSSLDVADSSWSEVVVRGGKVGALVAYGLEARRAALVGARIGYVNLRTAVLADVLFRDCRIDELELSDAELRSVSFPGSTIGRLVVTSTRCTRVDLSGATLEDLDGVPGLRGATLSFQQFVDLAPVFAAHLGVELT